MTTPTHPLADWDVCDVPGCPLTDPDAPEPDDIGAMLDTGMAHGVQHINISDHWWTHQGSPEPASDPHMPALLAAIDNALRNGSHMTGANLAFELLCERLGVDRNGLVFRPGWAASVPDLPAEHG